MFPIRDHNPSLRTPFVTYGLIAANVIIFIACLPYAGDERLLGQFYYDYGLVPLRVMQGDNLFGLFSSMFLHAGFLHLAGNMLFLWIFGDNLEDVLGHVGFSVFYLASGLGAAFLQILPDPQSHVPMVGASGAIAGVMGGYLLLFPRARVDVLVIFIYFIRIIPLPAWVMLGIWFGLQLLNGLAGMANDDGVAYFAHMGGFIVGILWVLPIWLRRGGAGYWTSTMGRPPHPEARYRIRHSTIPKVRRKRK